MLPSFKFKTIVWKSQKKVRDYYFLPGKYFTYQLLGNLGVQLLNLYHQTLITVLFVTQHYVRRAVIVSFHLIYLSYMP